VFTAAKEEGGGGEAEEVEEACGGVYSALTGRAILILAHPGRVFV
jgi:hypothetical protein